MHAYRDGEFGEALLHFRTALENRPIFPEATAAIGRVYRKDGNSDLAERHFRDALDRSAQLYVPEDKYAITYELAALYASRDRRKDRLDTLESVIADHPLCSEQEEGRRRTDAFLRVLRDDGIDRLLTLYRVPMDFAYQAFVGSGLLYLGDGRYNDAVRHLSVATIQALSTAVTEIRRFELDYEYSRLAEVLARIDGDEVLAAYAREVGLYRVLYYLAGALYWNQVQQSAIPIWRVLADADGAGEYRRRSRVQLESPQVETIFE
jgi:tetratricopeptide (TPR) repeat protein